MTATDAPHAPETTPATEERGDPSRTGTLWLGATGVAMLLAAAGVLTAVRWGEIGQTAKLGGFALVTLAMLVGGHRLRDHLPMTGRAVFHLGALLIPLDMAAVAVLADRSWQDALLLTAFAALAGWSVASQLDSSPVLRWARSLAVVGVAAGVAAVSSWSMPLALVVIAAVALLVGWVLDGRGAVAPLLDDVSVWAAVAGVLPLSAFVDWPSRIDGAASDLGLSVGHRHELVGAGILAALVAAGVTARRPGLARGWSTVVLGVLPAVVATASFDVEGLGPLNAAMTFVVGQLVLLVLAERADWKPIAGVVGPAGEMIAAIATFGVLIDALVDPTPMTAAAAVLFGLGWSTADRRRLLEPSDWLVGLVYGSGWLPATVLIPMTAVAAAAAFGGGALVVAWVLLAAAAWALTTARTHAGWAGVGFVAAALLIAPTTVAALPLIAATSLVAAFAARFRDDDRELLGVAALGAATAAVVPLGDLVGIDIAIVVLAGWYWAVVWTVAGALDGATSLLGRAASLLTIATLWHLSPVAGAVLVVVLAGAAAIDAARTGRRSFAILAAAITPLVVVPGGAILGLRLAESGYLLALVSLVATGLMIVLPQRLEPLLGTAAVVAGVVGILQAGTDPDLLGVALLFVGSALALFGAANRAGLFVGLGGVVVTCGAWVQLAVWNGTWLETYLAIPTVVALWAGRRWHRDGLSSWFAFAPTISLYGGIALLDRIEGGSAWHAVIAGAVAVGAIVSGAVWRLVGPLVAGTALLSAVVVYEALGPGAEVPTWGWLALGGSVLLGAAVALERAETTPVEQGQRLVHVLSTRFS